MERFETHGIRERLPLHERLLALPGQAILATAALPVLAPILIVRGVRNLAAVVKARRAKRAAVAAAAPPVLREAVRRRKPDGDALVHA
jgi:hypothetical protein